jgi:hypothetical protein
LEANTVLRSWVPQSVFGVKAVVKSISYKTQKITQQ